MPMRSVRLEVRVGMVGLVVGRWAAILAQPGP
jgi:hypothetical protein